MWKPPSKKEKEGKSASSLRPWNRKACRTISSALLQSIAKIRTQNVIKSSIKTLQDFSPHIPQKRKTVEREHNWIDEENVACGEKCHNAMNENPLHPCHGRDKLPQNCKALDV
jgi:hypothetical protein